MPDSARLMPFKRMLLRLCGVQVGRNVVISSGTRFIGSAKIILEDDVKLFSGVRIGGYGMVWLH